MDAQSSATAFPTHFSPAQVARLRQPVPDSYIEQREGGGGQKLSYIPGWYAIQAANEIFGEAGWDRDVDMTQLFAGPCEKQEYDRKEGKYRPGQVYRAVYSARVTVTVRTPSGAVIRRVGHGSGDGEAKLPYGNPKDAHELACKEAETDALKRALVTFGNAFGLHLYDKKSATRSTAGNPVVNVTPLVRPQGSPAQSPREAAAAAPTAGPTVADFLLRYSVHAGAERTQPRSPIADSDVVAWCSDLVGRIGAAAAPDVVYALVSAHHHDIAALAATHPAFAARVLKRAVERLERIAA